MATRMQQRRGTAQQWSTANPILAQGEIGFAFDTGVIKVGDGVTAWNVLDSAYIGKAGGDLILASSPGVVPLTQQGAVGQTADLHQYRDGSGAVVGRVAPNGDFYRGASRLVTEAVLTSDYIPKSMVDASGDLLVASAADTLVRFPRGSEGEVLTVSGSTLDWKGISGLPLATKYIAGGGSTLSAAHVWVNTDYFITFTVPSSGSIIVVLTGPAVANSATSYGNQTMWQLFDANTNALVESEYRVAGNPDWRTFPTINIPFTGLTAGQSKTYRLYHRTTDTRASASTGGTGSFKMQVEAN